MSVQANVWINLWLTSSFKKNKTEIRKLNNMKRAKTEFQKINLDKVKKSSKRSSAILTTKAVLVPSQPRTSLPKRELESEVGTTHTNKIWLQSIVQSCRKIRGIRLYISRRQEKT